MIKEAVEKHYELNQKIFDKDILKDEVRDKVEEIINEFLKILKEEEIILKVKDVILTGSNAIFNYNSKSDLDIHIVADTSIFDNDASLYQKLYNAYRRIFESKFDITFYGIPVELYVESQNNPVVSNGIYSIMHNKWIKYPQETKVPEIDQKKINELVKPWEARYKEIVDNAEDDPAKGEEEIDAFFNSIYELRHNGIKTGGEFDPGNLCFKEIRAKGYLDKLKKLKNELIEDRLSLEENTLLEDSEEVLTYQEQKNFEQKIYAMLGILPTVNIDGSIKFPLLDLDVAQKVIKILKTQPFIQDIYITTVVYPPYNDKAPDARKLLYNVEGKLNI